MQMRLQASRGRVIRRAAVLAVLASATVAGLATSSGASSSDHGSRAAPVGGRAGFVSLVPACACRKKTVIATFSLRNGRRIRTLGPVSTALGESLSLSGGRSGEVVATASWPAKCSSDVVGCGAIPNTCRGRVSRLAGSRLVPVFSEPSSMFIRGAVASPDGRLVAMLAGPCTAGAEHVLVRSLATGEQWIIGTDLPRCTSLSVPAWSAGGRQLVFAYGAVLTPVRPGPPGTCPETRYARLAVASALHGSRSLGWKLIPAANGCSFEVATFDRGGIAAVEGCRRRSAGGSYLYPGLGPARLVQLSLSGRRVATISLQPGWEDGAISTEPSGRVLISQDQPANEPYPERDWIWEYDGHSLRLIRHVKAYDAAQIIAIPYR